jgi:hypothetical protein
MQRVGSASGERSSYCTVPVRQLCAATCLVRVSPCISIPSEIHVTAAILVIGPPVAAVHVVCYRERSPPPLLGAVYARLAVGTRVSSSPLIRAAPGARVCVPLLSLFYD